VFSQPNGVTRVRWSLNQTARCSLSSAKSGSAKQVPAANNFATLKPLQEISGLWTVQFDSRWFYPTGALSGDSAQGLIGFDQLDDWSKRPELAVRHFSGTAVYEKMFTLSDAPLRTSHAAIWLDLGNVRELAEVKVNGQSCGVVWCPPWRVNVTDALKDRRKQAANRSRELLAESPHRDAKLPPEQRLTRTNVRKLTQKTPLMKSGLMGRCVCCPAGALLEERRTAADPPGKELLI